MTIYIHLGAFVFHFLKILLACFMIFGLKSGSGRDGSVVKSGWVLGTELQSSVKATTFIAYELITGYNSSS